MIRGGPKGELPFAAVSRIAVIIPVKAFSKAKGRLSSVLDDRARGALARTLALNVIAAAAPLSVIVVTNDEDVRIWAAEIGAKTVQDKGEGLSAAAHQGAVQAALEGFERVIVAHADLPHAKGLAWIGEFDGITLVPDRHGTGTNVIGLPASSSFRFAYGEGSFHRHCGEARRLGAPFRIVRDATLAWDVDVPSDLDTLTP